MALQQILWIMPLILLVLRTRGHGLDTDFKKCFNLNLKPKSKQKVLGNDNLR
jgi:hypothetical protein